jgi:hypothetical protein
MRVVFFAKHGDQARRAAFRGVRTLERSMRPEHDHWSPDDVGGSHCAAVQRHGFDATADDILHLLERRRHGIRTYPVALRREALMSRGPEFDEASEWCPDSFAAGRAGPICDRAALKVTTLQFVEECRCRDEPIAPGSFPARTLAQTAIRAREMSRAARTRMLEVALAILQQRMTS